MSEPAPADVVAGPGLRARVDLERGGKIVSLIDDAGHEWLCPPPGPLPPPARPGASFVASDLFGWDECAPTITACTLPDGRRLPDHGDLWDVAWAGDASAASVQGRSLPVRLTRRIRATDSGLLLSYEASAVEEDLPYLWAAHPQFAAPPGTRVQVDGLAEVVDVLSPDLSRLRWNASVDGIDTVPPGEGRKLYAAPEQAMTHARLQVPGHGVLSLRWDAEDLPYLGLWFDRGAYARQDVIALEPSCGYFDSLARASARGSARWLRAGTPWRWSLELSVDHGGSGAAT